MITLVAFACLVSALGADFAYSRTVARRAARWEQVQARGPDGVRADSASFTSGTGPVALLMVHGFGSSPAVFSRWADTLAGRGYTCRALRLPGFGEPLDSARNVTPDDWRRAVDAEIDDLRRTHADVWLVGHSLGGALCAEAGLRNAGEVKGLILLAPLCGVSSRRSLGVPPERLFGLRRALLFTDTFETCFPIDAHDPEVSKLEARDRYVPLNVYQGMFEVMRAGRAAAPQLRLPVWVAAAERDQVVDFRAVQAFAGDLRGPRSAFVPVAPAGHVLPLDTGWRELCLQADDFIRGGNH